MARSARSNLYNYWYGNIRISGEISKHGQSRQELPVKLFVLPTPLPSLASARRSVSQPLTSTADVYCLLRKMFSINMKEMAFLLITIDCCGLWLASQVLTVKEVLYLCNKYASSQTSDPLAKIRAILHPLVLLRSGPYIDRRLLYFPQYGIGILQMHSVQCDLPLWFLLPHFFKQTTSYMDVTFL